MYPSEESLEVSYHWKAVYKHFESFGRYFNFAAPFLSEVFGRISMLFRVFDHVKNVMESATISVPDSSQRE